MGSSHNNYRPRGWGALTLLNVGGGARRAERSECNQSGRHGENWDNIHVCNGRHVENWDMTSLRPTSPRKGPTSSYGPPSNHD